ncbi:hypothetical protein HYW84_01910 [Candidatus Peregrinibacteria bacterium]|nr:hypothetical protein [Candidatus Peregrinibacteria bacterium]
MFTKNFRREALWRLPLPVFLILFLWGMEARYPRVGGDFLPFFRQLLEGRWHFAHYGLAPLRYAVHLCGGLPLYGHPNDLYYSIPQLLVLIMDPWRAMELSAVVFLSAGYAGWRLFGSDVLRLSGPWNRVLALVMISSGFYFMHIHGGHINFFAYPLLGWLCWLPLSNEPKWLNTTARAALFGLLAAAILHTGGYYVLIFFGILFSAGLPLLLLYRDHADVPDIRTIVSRAFFSAAAAAAVSASKLVAVYSLMRVIPRAVDLSVLRVSPALFMLRSLWGFPQNRALFAGAPWSPHENSMFTSPVVLFGVVIAIFWLVFPNGKDFRRRIISLACFALLFLIFQSLVAGSGIAALALHRLPVFSSIRVSVRYLNIFSIILSVIGVCVLTRSARRWRPGADAGLAASAIVITLAGFFLAYRALMPQINLHLDYRQFRTELDRMESAGFTRIPVDRAVAGDTDFLGTTGIVCTEDALFTWMRQPVRKKMTPGPVRDERGGDFNMMKPACYAYGPANNCRPGDRIPAADNKNLDGFLTGGPMTWKISALQRAADALTIASLIAAVEYLFIEWFFRRNAARRAY